MKKALISLIVSTASLLAVPQAVVFDFGGVMTGESNREIVVNYIRQTLHLSETEFEKANQEKQRARQGGATDEEFWTAYAKANEIALPENFSRSFKSVLKEAIGANPEMYLLVEQLKGYKVPVAMLSNIDKRLAKLVKEFGLYDPFYPCLLSCEIGVEKPDPKAFELLINRLGLPPEEIVYIDDQPQNIDAAQKAGLDAILFESTEQLRSELNRRGVLRTP